MTDSRENAPGTSSAPPCPFCNSTQLAELSDRFDGGRLAWVHCETCGADGPSIYADSREPEIHALEGKAMHAWAKGVQRPGAGTTKGGDGHERLARPTTYLQRFADAVTLMCRGRKPPEAMVTGWLDGTDDRLQAFTAANGPQWAQGIVLLGAAALLANTPTEGVDHGARSEPPNT
jgi:hypothetical protein